MAKSPVGNGGNPISEKERSKTGQSSEEFTRIALLAGALGSGRSTGWKNED